MLSILNTLSSERLVYLYLSLVCFASALRSSRLYSQLLAPAPFRPYGQLSSFGYGRLLLFVLRHNAFQLVLL